jgi:hypothetical protein
MFGKKGGISCVPMDTIRNCAYGFCIRIVRETSKHIEEVPIARFVYSRGDWMFVTRKYGNSMEEYI